MPIIYHADCLPHLAQELGWLTMEAYKIYYGSRVGSPDPTLLELEAGHYHVVSIIRSKALKMGRHKIFGYLATKNQCAYVVFRGTESVSEWVGDGKFLQAAFLEDWGKVHRGFRRIYQSCAQALINTIHQLNPEIKHLYVTGHSLGAALSTLACMEIFEKTRFKHLEHYTFASPRVGNLAFAKKFGTHITKSYRIFNTEDIIPTEPKAATVGSMNQYAHIGIPIAFTHAGKSIIENHLMETYLQHL